jgi:DnaJ-class molecular chaperone
MDPYKILNVSRDASDSEIKKAYRKLAAKHHPDKGGDEATFKKINEAYSTIGSKDSRQQHEASHIDIGDMFGGFGDIFEDFFGSRSHSRRRQQREQTDDDILFDFKISLSQIKQGISETISFNRTKKCSKCAGVGGKNKSTCNKCNGNGAQTIRVGPLIQQSTCQPCLGRGHSFEEACGTCKGSGMIQVRENINVTIKNK